MPHTKPHHGLDSSENLLLFLLTIYLHPHQFSDLIPRLITQALMPTQSQHHKLQSIELHQTNGGCLWMCFQQSLWSPPALLRLVIGQRETWARLVTMPGKEELGWAALSSRPRRALWSSYVSCLQLLSSTGQTALLELLKIWEIPMGSQVTPTAQLR